MVIASINLHIVSFRIFYFFIQIHKGKSNEDEICRRIKTGFNSKFAELGEQTSERNKEEVIRASLNTGDARGR